jgi:hypothetical protein
MSVSTILEICIGLVLLYYILGVMVSAITSWITMGFQIRANDLESYFKKLFQSESKLKDVLAHPLVTSLQPIRLTPIVGLLTGKTKEYKTEKIPAATFLQAFIGQSVASLQTVDEITTEINKSIADLPDTSEFKKEITQLINEAGTNAAQLRSTIEGWFDGVMQKSSALYTAHARRIVIILALVVTLVTGIDSIDIAKQLWDQPNLRAVAAAKAVEISGGGELEPDIKLLITTLDELDFQYQHDWWNTRNTPEAPNTVLLKVIGLTITWAAVAQGSSFWYDVMKKVTAITKATASTSSQEVSENEK